MKTHNFYIKFAFKDQIIENVLLSFEISSFPHPFTLVQLDRNKKTLTNKSSRFIFSGDHLYPEKFLKKASQLHE